MGKITKCNLTLLKWDFIDILFYIYLFTLTSDHLRRKYEVAFHKRGVQYFFLSFTIKETGTTLQMTLSN